MKFQYRSIANTDSSYPYQVTSYLNKMPEYNKVTPELFELCKDDTELDQSTMSSIEEYNNIMKELSSDRCSIFSNTLIYHMKRLNIEPSTLKNQSKLSLTSINNYCNGEYDNKQMDSRNVMALCIGLKLESEYCQDLFIKANCHLQDNISQKIAYTYLFNYTHYGIEKCNKILRVFKQEKIPYKRGNLGKKEKQKT